MILVSFIRLFLIQEFHVSYLKCILRWWSDNSLSFSLSLDIFFFNFLLLNSHLLHNFFVFVWCCCNENSLSLMILNNIFFLFLHFFARLIAVWLLLHIQNMVLILPFILFTILFLLTYYNVNQFIFAFEYIYIPFRRRRKKKQMKTI